MLFETIFDRIALSRRTNLRYKKDYWVFGFENQFRPEHESSPINVVLGRRRLTRITRDHLGAKENHFTFSNRIM